MRASRLVLWLLCACFALAVPVAAQTTTTTATDQNTAPQSRTLGKFISDALVKMKLPSGTRLAGLSDADATISDFENLGPAMAAAKVAVGPTTFQLMTYQPTGKQVPILVLFAKKMRLDSLIPDAAGTPLAALGTLENAAFIFAPPGAAGRLLAPSPADSDSDSDSQTTPPVILNDIRVLAQSNINIAAGMNLVATVPLRNMSRELSALLRAVGVPANFALPIRGAVGADLFRSAFRKGAVVASPPGLLTASARQSKLAAISRNYGKDFLSQLKLTATLPDVASAGPFAFKDHAFNVLGSDGHIVFGVDIAVAVAHGVDLQDIHITYDVDERTVLATGKVDGASLGKLVKFKGLDLGTISLASAYEGGKWSFQLNGDATLNGTEVQLSVEEAKTPGPKLGQAW